MRIGHADLIVAILRKHNGRVPVAERGGRLVIPDASSSGIAHGGSTEILMGAKHGRLVTIADGEAILNRDHPQSCDIVALVAEKVPLAQLKKLGLVYDFDGKPSKRAIADLVQARRVLLDGVQPPYASQWDTTVALSAVGDDPAVEILPGYSAELVADARKLTKGYVNSPDLGQLVGQLENLVVTVEGAQTIAVKAQTVVNKLVQQLTAIEGLKGEDRRLKLIYISGGSGHTTGVREDFQKAMDAKRPDMDAVRAAGAALVAECIEISKRMQVELAQTAS